MAEKREKKDEKRDGFQPLYSFPGPWNNFGFPYSHGPQFPHPSLYPHSNLMVMKKDWHKLGLTSVKNGSTPSVKEVRNDQETIREGRPEQNEKIEKLCKKRDFLQNHQIWSRNFYHMVLLKKLGGIGEKCPPLRRALEDIALQFFMQILKNQYMR